MYATIHNTYFHHCNCLGSQRIYLTISEAQVILKKNFWTKNLKNICNSIWVLTSAIYMYLTRLCKHLWNSLPFYLKVILKISNEPYFQVSIVMLFLKEQQFSTHECAIRTISRVQQEGSSAPLGIDWGHYLGCV